MQMIYSALNLRDMNIGQLQRFTAAGGLLCIMASTCFTLFLSSRFKNTVASLSVSLLFCILPIIIYMALPSGIGTYIYSVLPAGGTGLQTSILYAAIDFDFWNIGNLSVWLPYVMFAAYAVEIPLFLVLAVCSYSRHKV